MVIVTIMMIMTMFVFFCFGCHIDLKAMLSGLGEIVKNNEDAQVAPELSICHERQPGVRSNDAAVWARSLDLSA